MVLLLLRVDIIMMGRRCSSHINITTTVLLLLLLFHNRKWQQHNLVGAAGQSSCIQLLNGLQLWCVVVVVVDCRRRLVLYYRTHWFSARVVHEEHRPHDQHERRQRHPEAHVAQPMCRLLLHECAREVHTTTTPPVTVAGTSSSMISSISTIGFRGGARWWSVLFQIQGMVMIVVVVVGLTKHGRWRLVRGRAMLLVLLLRIVKCLFGRRRGPPVRQEQSRRGANGLLVVGLLVLAVLYYYYYW